MAPYKKALNVSLKIGMVLLAIAGASCSRSPQSTSQRDTPLVAKTTRLDLGDLGEGQSKVGEILLTNTGPSAIQIDKVSASCGCTMAKVEPASIPPEETAKVFVELTPQGRRGPFGSQVVLDWSDQNGAKGQLAVSAQARALYLANLSPSHLDFGTVKREDIVPPKVATLMRGTESIPFTNVTIEAQSKNTSFKIKPASENEWEISCQLIQESAPNGHFHDTAELVFRTADGKELARRKISVRAKIRGLVSVSPKTLYFGVLQPGETREGTLNFTIADGRSAKIENIRLEPDSHLITFESRESEPGKALVHYRLISSEQTGDISRRAIFRFDNPSLGEITIPIVAYVKN